MATATKLAFKQAKQEEAHEKRKKRKKRWKDGETENERKMKKQKLRQLQLPAVEWQQKRGHGARRAWRGSTERGGERRLQAEKRCLYSNATSWSKEDEEQ